MFKKLFAVLLSLFLTAAVLPQSVYAESETDEFEEEEEEYLEFGDFTYIRYKTQVMIAGYTGSESEVTIPEKIDDLPVTGIGTNAFEYCEFQSVTIPSSVKRINDYAFASCYSLKQLNLCEGLEEIGYCAFVYCMSLYNVEIPDSVTCIKGGAFSDCRLASVKIPESVTEIGSKAFGYNHVHYEDNEFDNDNRPNIITDFVICGIEGSEAEKYAEENKFLFRIENGWLEWFDKRYFFEDYVPVTGWKKHQKRWYWFDPDGVMVTGWKKISNKWYWFEADGAMATGWKKLSGKWYYFGSSGAMKTGWLRQSGKWYYFNRSGAMLKGWQKIAKKWYYFLSSGAMVTGWKKIGGKWYYFQSSGAMKTGWLKLSGKWYYFNSSGAMVTGTVKIGSKTYTFNSSGVCQNP
ncbi:MAG: leucine-rich repeat protein [Solobacterium sp.]|nr:leucine-rich repeat protein [Solobacterium sp.]